MKWIALFQLIVLALAVNSQTIYDIQGQASASPFNGQEVSTKGIVTAVYPQSYFIQDGDSAWTGLYVWDQTQKPALGDSIVITGTIEEYYDLTELTQITEYTLLSSDNTLPEPILISTGDAQEKWESILVKVEGAECTNPDLGYGEWELNDGSGAVVINDLGVAYVPIQGVIYNVTGPLDYSFEQYKIEPRTEDDIEQDLSIFFSKDPKATQITKTSLNIELAINSESSAYIEYGFTTEYELGKEFSTVSSTTHHVNLTGLQAAEVYYTKSYAINAVNDTTPIHYGVFATQSESSGEIKSYFTYEPTVFTLKSTPTNLAIPTIIEYIKKAKESLDIAIYDLTNHADQSDSSNYEIIQAINKVFDAGVKVRIISDAKPGNYALDSLNPNIPILKRDSDGIMHHKFIIIDVNNSDNSWVVAGSTNWTYNNLLMDFNNIISIQDQSLAKAYLLEFNEMWGSNSLTPNPEESKFGKDKSDNTPHQFNISGTPVELYFSPSDKTTSKIEAAIEDAEESVDFAMMVFTEDKLGNAVVNAKNRGLSAYGFIDYVEYSGSEFEKLLNNGIDVYDFTNEDGSGWPNSPSLHHKYCILDKFSDNALLISGTHNWSASAESKNDENTLFIYDKNIAALFSDHILSIEQFVFGFDDIKQISENNLKVYPNPSNGKFTVELNKEGNYDIEVIDILGNQIVKFNNSSKSSNVTINNAGVYLIIAKSDHQVFTHKLIIE